jgi:multiple sugar transport system ATP-binding protein
VYDNPEDTFVAGFLGSPPMNLLRGDDCTVGFRPERFLPLSVHESREELVPLWFRVNRVEDLGSDRLLYGTLHDTFPNERVIVNLPFTVHFPVVAGGVYEFAIKEKDIKFFDKETGRRTEPRRFWAKR